MKWVQLRRDARCAFGCEVSSRSWVLLARYRAGLRRFVCCEACAADRYGMKRPALDPNTLPPDRKVMAYECE